MTLERARVLVGAEPQRHRRIPVGAEADAANPNESSHLHSGTPELQLVRDGSGRVIAIELTCSCGDRHRIDCDYADQTR